MLVQRVDEHLAGSAQVSSWRHCVGLPVDIPEVKVSPQDDNVVVLGTVLEILERCFELLLL